METTLRKLRKKPGMEKVLELMVRDVKEKKRRFFDLSWLWRKNQGSLGETSLDWLIYCDLQQALVNVSQS
jgi:hypothetical protein